MQTMSFFRSGSPEPCPVFFLLEWLKGNKTLVTMGKGGKKSGGQAAWPQKGKGVGGARRGAALSLPAHYGLDVLRPYHGEDGSIFVKRPGATRDADLLSADGLSQRLNAGNSELLNRPGKGITMLGGTIFHGLSAVRFAEDRLPLRPCTDPTFHQAYVPFRPGYASTVLKLAGAELPHVVLWLDAKHVAGAAYTGMSRVARAQDLLFGGQVHPDHFAPALG